MVKVMRITKSGFLQALCRVLKRVILALFLVGTPSVIMAHTCYKTPYEACRELLEFEDFDEFSCALKNVINNLVALAHTYSGNKIEFYSALLDDYEQYAFFMTHLMIHTETKKIVYAPRDIEDLRRCGYSLFVYWAQDNAYEPFFMFYTSYVVIAASIACSLLHDIPVTNSPDALKLTKRAKKIVSTLRTHFYPISATPFGQQYHALPSDYLVILNQAEEIAQKGSL